MRVLNGKWGSEKSTKRNWEMICGEGLVVKHEFGMSYEDFWGNLRV